MLVGIAATLVLLVVGRVPFEASVNRAPGTLYALDDDGYVRNTYLLNITSNHPGDTAVPYLVTIEGLDNAELIAPEVHLASAESRTLPLVVRLLTTDELERTIPVRVRIVSAGSELLLGTTFKTGADVGSSSP
jgi:hypothetical protein